MADLIQKYFLLKGLLTGNSAGSGPLYVDIDLTTRCNLHCAGCIYHSTQIAAAPPHVSAADYISAEMIDALCADLKRMRTRSIILQGAGEPLLHPECIKIIRRVKESRFHLTLLTNGTLLDSDMISALIASAIDVVKVSLLDSSDPSGAEDGGVPASRSRDAVMRRIQMLRAQRRKNGSRYPQAWLHCPISRQNGNDLDSLVDRALESGCEGITFSPFWPPGGELQSLALAADEERQMVQNLARIKQKLDALHLHHNIAAALRRYCLGAEAWKHIPCYSAWYHARVRTDGTVQPCGRCRLSLGSLQEKPFHAIWMDAPIREFRAGTSTCAGLARYQNQCDCSWCCFSYDNWRIHRRYRFLAPFAGRARRGRHS